MVLLRLLRFSRRLRARRSLGFCLVASVMAFSILANAICYYVFDRSVNPDVTFGDAVWYSVISVTTIGYGDFSAQTLGARLGTVVFIVILGLSSFSVFLGMVIDGVGSRVSKGKRGLLKIMAQDHVLIVNFPREARVRQIIDEIRSDPQHHAIEIVVISDQVEQLPFLIDNVMFVRGSPHDPETYERAMAKQARMAIVLSRDYSDPNSDAVAAAAVSVISSIEDDIHIVAECLDDAHRSLFMSVRCDAIVSGFSIAGNLLAQEIHDPGISRMIEVLTSNRKGATLFSTKVADGATGGYANLAKSLLDHGINLLAVNRGTESLTDLGSIQPASGDSVIYAGRQRYTWQQLTAMT
ncbi:MAG: voltage-gated potassium channel [Planctomycetota bacterium]|jgi:voltage-gated potassium channel